MDRGVLWEGAEAALSCGKGREFAALSFE